MWMASHSHLSHESGLETSCCCKPCPFAQLVRTLSLHIRDKNRCSGADRPRYILKPALGSCGRGIRVLDAAGWACLPPYAAVFQSGRHLWLHVVQNKVPLTAQCELKTSFFLSSPKSCGLLFTKLVIQRERISWSQMNFLFHVSKQRDVFPAMRKSNP